MDKREMTQEDFDAQTEEFYQSFSAISDALWDEVLTINGEYKGWIPNFSLIQDIRDLFCAMQRDRMDIWFNHRKEGSSFEPKTQV